MRVHLDYGTGGLEVQLPDERVTIIEPVFRPPIADPHAAFIVGEAAARPELENLAVGVLEEARLFVGRFLRGFLAEIAADRSNLDGMLLLLESPARDVELVRTLIAAVAVAVVPVPVPVVMKVIAVERPFGRRSQRKPVLLPLWKIS